MKMTKTKKTKKEDDKNEDGKMKMTKMNIFLYDNVDITGGDAVPREGGLGQQALPQQVPFQLRSTNQQQETHKISQTQKI